MKKILVIVDQRDNLNSIKDFFKNFLPDCKIFYAESVEKGIAIVQKEQPDTILLDIIMPEMDVFEVCKVLKQDKRTRLTPILILSALGQDPQSRVKGLELGADAFLAKPFIPAELKAQINVMLRIKQAEDELRAEKGTLKEAVLEKMSELVESERRTNTLINNLQGIAYRCNNDRDRTMEFISEGIIEITGYNPKDIINNKKLSFNEIIVPEDRDRVWEEIQSAVSKKESFEIDYRIKTSSGALKYLSEKGNGVFDSESGKFLALEGFINDVTKSKLSEKAHLESEQKFKDITERIFDVIIVAGLNGNIIYVSPSITRTFGYQTDELIVKNITDIVPKFDISHLIETFKISNGGKSIEEHEYQFIRKDASIANVSLSAQPIFENNKIVGGQIIVRDITESKLTDKALRESETRFRKYFEQGLIGMAITSVDKGFIEVNDNFCEILGYSFEELSDISWEELTHPDDIESDLALFKQLIACEIDSYSLEKRFIQKSGKIVFVAMSINTMHKDDGTVDYLLAIFDDITERKQAEKALRSSEELYRNVFNNSPLGILHFNREGEITDCNKELLRILGSTKEKIVGLNMIKQLNDQKIIKAVEETLVSGSAYFNDFYTSVTGEKTTPVVIHFKAIYDLEDKIIGGVGMVENITDRKLAEEALQASEELNRSITQSAADAIISMDQDGSVLSWNKAAEKIFGYSSNEIINSNLSLIIPNKFQKGHIAGVGRLKNGGIKKLVGGTIEITAIRKSGLEFPIELSLSSWESNDQKYFTGIIRDITERKKAEEELIRSEKRFRRLFDGLGDAVFVTKIGGNDKGRILEVNAAAIIQTKYSREELLEMNIINDLSVAGSGELDTSIWEEKLLKGETVTTVERKKRKDGTEFWTEMIVTQIDFRDEKASLSINHDITNRKRTEQIQKALYNISNAVIVKDNLEKLIKFIRKELGKIIDTTNFYVALYDKKNDTLTLPFLVDEMEDSSNIPAGKTLTKYVINTKKTLLATKDRVKDLKENGHIEIFGTESEVWLGIPLKIEDKVVGVLAVQSYTDENAYTSSDVDMLEFVSDQISIFIGRKKAHDDLIDALKKATESDRLKSAFLATISHELRTPLNAIIGFSDLITNDWSLEEIYGFAKTINESGTHLLSIVEEIFDITLIETGETTINKKDENLHLILRNIRKIINNEQQKLNKEGLELNLIIPFDDAHLTIYTDIAKFKQILLNLLKNALKFTHEGHISFGYSFIHQDNKRMIRFYVEDTGIGIPKDKQELIFTTFRQVEESFSRTYGGTGIGLSISTKLTELLGGKLWLESEEGAGCTFYFTIPFPNYEAGSFESTDLLKIEKDKVRGDKTFLIVEDDKISFEFLQIVLEKPDTKIIWAKDGKEAIKYCKEMPEINLVLMDINMHVMDGYDATREIKKFRPKLPIIAQTAFAIAGDREKTQEAGCDDYIAKPIVIAELREKIEKWT